MKQRIILVSTALAPEAGCRRKVANTCAVTKYPCQFCNEIPSCSPGANLTILHTPINNPAINLGPCVNFEQMTRAIRKVLEK